MEFWDSFGASFVNAVVRNKHEIGKYMRLYQKSPVEQLEEIRKGDSQYSQAQRTAANKLLSER